MHGWLNFSTPVNVIQHITKMKDKSQMISIDAERAFDKIQHPFMILKISTKGIEGTYLNRLKVICVEAHS